MTKSELICRFGEQYSGCLEGLTADDLEESAKLLIDVMADALSQGHRIEIRGFGSFDLSHRAARLGRNPRTGEKVAVPEKWVPHFKPGKDLRERVDNMHPR